MIKQDINDFCPCIFRYIQSTRVWGQCLIYRTTDSYDRGDTATTSLRPMPQRTPKMDFKIYYFFVLNKLLPQSQCAFDWKEANFIWDERRRKVM
jgi:hypothetical protein